MSVCFTCGCCARCQHLMRRLASGRSDDPFQEHHNTKIYKVNSIGKPSVPISVPKAWPPFLPICRTGLDLVQHRSLGLWPLVDRDHLVHRSRSDHGIVPTPPILGLQGNSTTVYHSDAAVVFLLFCDGPDTFVQNANIAPNPLESWKCVLVAARTLF